MRKFTAHILFFWMFGLAVVLPQAGQGEVQAGADALAGPAEAGVASVPGRLPEPVFAQDFSTVTLGSWRIQNGGLKGRPRNRQVRQPEDWRHYMHAVRDYEARPVSWNQLLGDVRLEKRWLDPEVTLQTPVKSSTLPVLRLGSEKMLVLPRPVLSEAQLAELKGRTVRFFVWVRAEEAGLNLDLWDGAPAVSFSLKDSLNNLISTTEGMFKTRGTFPWFCYHIEVPIPATLLINATAAAPAEGDGGGGMDLAVLRELLNIAGDEQEERIPDGGGLYITLKNQGSGEAWFSTLAWEIAVPANTPGRALWTDPVSGSRSPNPDYDEFPLHLYFGLDSEKTWNFLQGTRNYADLTRISGLRAYVQRARQDWFHMQHGVPYLLYLYHTGTLLKQSSSFEEGWLEELRLQISGLQDENTGLWGYGGHADILISRLIAANNFAPRVQRRSDDPEPAETAWRAFNGGKLEHAGQIVQALAGSRVVSEDGRKLGWNRYAFQPVELGTARRRQFSDLGTTEAALTLLALISSQTEDDALRQQCAQLVREAWEYVTENLVTADFLWRQNERDFVPTTGGFMLQLQNASACAEPKIVNGLADFKVEPFPEADGGMKVKWMSWGAGHAGLRIYAAPAELAPEGVNEKHLIAIINRRKDRAMQRDPLFMLMSMSAAAKARWGIDPQSAGADYLVAKLAMLRPNLAIGEGSRELIISKEQILGPVSAPSADVAPDAAASQEGLLLKYYAAAVTAYGEMTPLKMIYEEQ